MFSERYEEKECNLAYPLKKLCCVVYFPYMQFNFVARIKAILVYLALTNSPKFKRGQGQTSIMLLAIKFLKTIS